MTPDRPAPPVKPSTDTAETIEGIVTAWFTEVGYLSSERYSLVTALQAHHRTALAARDAELEAACRRLYNLARLEDDYDDFIYENGTPPTLLWCLEAAEEADQSFRKLAALYYEDRCRDPRRSPAVPTTDDELRAAVQRAVPRRDGDWYPSEVDALIAAVRPLVEAQERARIADWLRVGFPTIADKIARGDTP